MKRVIMAWALLICAVCIGHNAALAAADGEKIYRQSCLSCHGNLGETPKGKAINGIKVYNVEENMRIFSGYADGTYGGQAKAAMQSVLSALSDEEKEAVARYVGSLKK